MYCACPLEWDGRSSKFYVSQRVLGSMAGLAAKHLGYHMGFSARWEGFFLKVVLSDR
jgi:L-asparagine transporter-like permease